MQVPHPSLSSTNRPTRLRRQALTLQNVVEGILVHSPSPLNCQPW